MTPSHFVPRNSESIGTASQYLTERGIVVIFPEGTIHQAHTDLREVKVYSGFSEIAEPETEGQIPPPVVPIFIKGSERYRGVLGKGTGEVVIYIGSPQYKEQQEAPSNTPSVKEKTERRRDFRNRVWNEVVRLQQKNDPEVKRVTSTPIDKNRI